MSRAELLNISIERFKSFQARTEIQLAPLTIILGRNNSGKSTLIQALLLLKQTLADPRVELPLKLKGLVEAYKLSDLAWNGGPNQSNAHEFILELTWGCEIDSVKARKDALNPDPQNLLKHADLNALHDLVYSHGQFEVNCRLTLIFGELEGVPVLSRASLGVLDKHQLTLLGDPNSCPIFEFFRTSKSWSARFRGESAKSLSVEFDHFLPYILLDRRAIGARSRERAWHNAYVMLFAQPIEALKRLLLDLQFLGSARVQPKGYYEKSASLEVDVGANGEYAASLLERRQSEVVHFLLPLNVDKERITRSQLVHEKTLVDAMNDVLQSLSIKEPLTVKASNEVFFQLLFGRASLPHVGRGLSHLLPLIQLGLLADPLRFEKLAESMSIQDYNAACRNYGHIAIEEPEAHLHPKVQSRLAHWFVSLAMSNRRLMIETHSDHLVRRLRGLVARAGARSELEQWLLRNVVILEVEQDETGRSSVKSSRLTADGGIGESWPADFMEESSEEDSTIYFAKLDKADVVAPRVEWIEGDEPESDEAP